MGPQEETYCGNIIIKLPAAAPLCSFTSLSTTVYIRQESAQFFLNPTKVTHCPFDCN